MGSFLYKTVEVCGYKDVDISIEDIIEASDEKSAKEIIGTNDTSLLSPTQSRLIKYLNKNGPTIRRDLVKILNTPRTTIYDNLFKLQKRKVVEKFTKNNGKWGRPLVFWKVK